MSLITPPGKRKCRTMNVEKILAQMKSEGKKYIPSEWCPNVKEDGSCGCWDAEIWKKS